MDTATEIGLSRLEIYDIAKEKVSEKLDQYKNEKIINNLQKNFNELLKLVLYDVFGDKKSLIKETIDSEIRNTAEVVLEQLEAYQYYLAIFQAKKETGKSIKIKSFGDFKEEIKNLSEVINRYKYIEQHGLYPGMVIQFKDNDDKPSGQLDIIDIKENGYLIVKDFYRGQDKAGKILRKSYNPDQFSVEDLVTQANQEENNFQTIVENNLNEIDVKENLEEAINKIIEAKNISGELKNYIESILNISEIKERGQMLIKIIKKYIKYYGVINMNCDKKRKNISSFLLLILKSGYEPVFGVNRIPDKTQILAKKGIVKGVIIKIDNIIYEVEGINVSKDSLGLTLKNFETSETKRINSTEFEQIEVLGKADNIDFSLPERYIEEFETV